MNVIGSFTGSARNYSDTACDACGTATALVPVMLTKTEINAAWMQASSDLFANNVSAAIESVGQLLQQAEHGNVCPDMLPVLATGNSYLDAMVRSLNLHVEHR